MIDLLYHELHNVIFLDIRMPVLDGFETAKEVHKIFPSVKIIAISLHEDYDSLRLMLNYGCVGYLTKDTDEHELQAAIIAVINGEKYIDPVFNDENFFNPIPEEILSDFNLTLREIEIVKQIALGKKSSLLVEKKESQKSSS